VDRSSPDLIIGGAQLVFIRGLAPHLYTHSSSSLYQVRKFESDAATRRSDAATRKSISVKVKVILVKDYLGLSGVLLCYG
jgi:hypothetical protein